MRVLIVDDFPDVTEALRMLLGVLGHEVTTARSGKQALETVERELPDVAMCDVGLPDLSGYEVARAIRRRPGGRRTFLAAITGWGANKDRVDAMAAGFDLHLVKPIDAAKVIKLLSTAESVLRTRDGAS